MTHLKLFADPAKQVSTATPIFHTIQTGCRCQIKYEDATVLDSIHGVIGGYRISKQSAEVLPVASKGAKKHQICGCYFWDPGIDLTRLNCHVVQNGDDKFLPLKNCRIRNNRLILNRSTLDGPELITSNEATLLRLSPRFDFTLSTDDYAAQLGIINLVQSSRVITTGDVTEVSEYIVLRDTGIEDAPVLYLDNPQDDQAVKFISERQEQGSTRNHTFEFNISQPIDSNTSAANVSTVTVLEQYTSYVMQGAVLSDEIQTIWSPVFSPISWGWSIRVGRRIDGEWGILRRKLILPTIGNDGLQIPTWHNNIFDFSVLSEGAELG